MGAAILLMKIDGKLESVTFARGSFERAIDARVQMRGCDTCAVDNCAGKSFPRV